MLLSLVVFSKFFRKCLSKNEKIIGSGCFFYFLISLPTILFLKLRAVPFFKTFDLKIIL
ncbi:Hypothetical Protein SLY_0745 [Strawberry lethal yellows phytoplasma (CPA) str. NZSb11]|uniref:Uncharacterized protein n=1 Tax=Strawberry lethal yellows phytoplasma (CPA) str. NZSb11 TaxID=980422 RepID=R4RMU5_PHYAS|nr:Hypothetical Protein SLY_0745 [Strawberry lethal yellows phytoplasma (CPA) str. NZSb11]